MKTKVWHITDTENFEDDGFVVKEFEVE